MATHRATASLRTRLSLTYAGIALLTAALLGGILLSVLGGYYARAEEAFLQQAAVRVLEQPAPSREASLERWAVRAAVVAQARVQLFAADGGMLVDSGPLSGLDPYLLDLDDEEGEPRERRERRPGPLGDGVFGGSGGEPSGRSLRIDLDQGGYLVLSEVPVSGSEVLGGIARAWLLAAALAVALAALAGYLLSSRISRPVVDLTQASARMAQGDLSARALTSRNDEFGRLAVSFNEMAARIETTIVSLRRFVADAAHEIGTPLTALSADLQLAEKAATTDDERRLILRSLAQARRLETLSQGLLALSRIEAGEVARELEEVDAAAVAGDAAAAIASRAEQAGISLSVEIESEPLRVLADRGKLEAVLGSLLDNAVKFTPAGGGIALSAQRTSDDVMLAVTDTGVGIPEAEVDAVFERFHRARNVSAYPGSGLGLAIARATVQRFGGTISVSSSAAGSRFEVRLPGV